MVKRGGGENVFHRRKKFGVLLKRQASHQDRARVDFLMSGLCGELGKEIHRWKSILSQKSEQKAKLFHAM
jgi:hypothetical protein